MKIERKFINELGNKIYIKVSKEKDKVIIIIKGPKSTSENIITYKEAKQLKSIMRLFNFN